MSSTGADRTTDLVYAAQGGSRLALEALFRRYLPRVRQIVALRLGYRLTDFYRYEDIVQDTLLNLFLKLDRFDTTSEARFRAWLASCTTNSVREHFRRARAKKRSALPSTVFPSEGLLAEILPSRESPPPALAEFEECAERVEAALLRLPERERDVIIYVRLCGMSSDETADRMGISSPAAARKLLSRSLERLRRLLDET